METTGPTNYRLTIAYDGRAFFGWQRLKDHPTVQGTLEAAVEAACGEPVKVIGAAHTDRGAHAQGQVIGFRLARGVPVERLWEGLDAALPGTIELRDAEVVPWDLHVRKAATGFAYDYWIANVPALPPELDGRVWHIRDGLDVDAMRAALEPVRGEHDFASFVTPGRGRRRAAISVLDTATLEARDDGMLIFHLAADRWYGHMARNLVRAIVKVGEERLTPAALSDVLAARDRAAAPGSAPASGLYLMGVRYGGEAEAPSRGPGADPSRARSTTP